MTDSAPNLPTAADEANPDLRQRIRVGALHEIYGKLLTDRQSEFIHLHFNEDLSYSEVAREFDVTRQAVHDAIKHGIDAMEKYEAALGILGRGVATSTAALGELATRLESLYQHLRQSGGILYDVAPVAKELKEIADALRAVPGTAAEDEVEA